MTTFIVGSSFLLTGLVVGWIFGHSSGFSEGKYQGLKSARKMIDDGSWERWKETFKTMYASRGWNDD